MKKSYEAPQLAKIGSVSELTETFYGMSHFFGKKNWFGHHGYNKPGEDSFS